MQWSAAIAGAALLATSSSMPVMADSTCLVNGEPAPNAQPSECDPGTGPNAASDPAPVVPEPEPEPTPEPPPEPTDPEPTSDPVQPEPTTDPVPPVTDPEPTTDPVEPTPPTEPEPTDPQPTDPKPTTDPVQPEPTKPKPTTEKPSTSKPQPASPRPDERTTSTREASHDDHSHVGHTHATINAVTPSSYVDARTFREEFKPTGRIPEIPQLEPETLADITSAAQRFGVDWSLLAGIAWTESRWGDPAAGAFVGAGLGDARWAEFGTDGDGDGEVSRDSRADQLATVAAMLASADGKPGSEAALLEYFHGGTGRVKRATYLAAYYAALGPVALEKGLDAPETLEELSARVLADDRITVYPGGRSDIQAGLIDPRVLATLQFLANRHEELTVSSLVTGHSVFTKAGNVSLHSYGQAVDIATLGGKSVLGNQQRDSATVKALKDVLLMPESMQPSELISLWSLGGPSFAMADHHDHVHIGFKTGDER